MLDKKETRVKTQLDNFNNARKNLECKDTSASLSNVSVRLIHCYLMPDEGRGQEYVDEGKWVIRSPDSCHYNRNGRSDELMISMGFNTLQYHRGLY